MLACLNAWAVTATPSVPDSVGVVTILDGDATALQGTARVLVVEGLRLAATAIVETGAGTRLLRIEADDGTLIDLGPQTRVMLAPSGSGARGNRVAALYLLQGWAKLSTPPGDGTVSALSAPGLDVPAMKGVSLAFVSRDESLLFLESGDAQLIERYDGKGAAPLVLKNTEFYARAGAEKGKISARPTAAMLQRLPPAFRDTLPRRAAAFKGRAVEAKALAPPSYDDMQAWLTGEPSLRRAFPRRFAARAREPEFRQALIANLAAHPEWRSLLFPPVPKPKPRFLPFAPAASARDYYNR
jgi:hypothetical protein